MPVLDNEFTCPNGHSFKANAKLRARCVQCGSMARKDFTAAPVIEKPVEDKPEVKPEDKPEVKKPRLIRQGKPRMAAPKKVTPIVKKKVAGGLVKSRRVTGKVMPGITKMPRKTNRARVTSTARGNDKPYWHSVAEKYGL